MKETEMECGREKEKRDHLRGRLMMRRICLCRPFSVCARLRACVCNELCSARTLWSVRRCCCAQIKCVFWMSGVCVRRLIIAGCLCFASAYVIVCACVRPCTVVCGWWVKWNERVLSLSWGEKAGSLATFIPSSSIGALLYLTHLSSSLFHVTCYLFSSPIQFFLCLWLCNTHTHTHTSAVKELRLIWAESLACLSLNISGVWSFPLNYCISV